MKRSLFVSLFVLVPGVSQAGDPLACVDPDIASAFINSDYSTEVPDAFENLDVPTDFSLIGSRSSASNVTVVYQTEADTDDARDLAVDRLTESGWIENADRRYSRRGGFQVEPAMSRTVLCRDDEPYPIAIVANEKPGKTFVSYIQYPRATDCQKRPGRGAPNATLGLMDQLPVLTLPDGVVAGSRRTGGGGDEANTRIDISGATGRTDLLDFFEEQIRQQNWEYQTGWSSHLSSGSVWMAETDASGILIGTLHVFDNGDDPVRVRFSANPADPKRGVERGGWTRVESNR